jgi:hypothetical protein
MIGGTDHNSPVIRKQKTGHEAVKKSLNNLLSNRSHESNATVNN